MILLVPEKAFKKKIVKWVREKDFVIADALERHDATMNKYGNKIDCDELNPSPSLTMIAMDPYSEESRIKRRRLLTYLNMWLTDEAFEIKVHFLVSTIVKHYRQTGEDLNIFVVMRKEVFYAYHEAVERHINETYGEEICTFLTHDLPNKTAKEILSRRFDQEFYKALRKKAKRIGKDLNIPANQMLSLEE